jgi:hypothetical protein
VVGRLQTHRRAAGEAAAEFRKRDRLHAPRIDGDRLPPQADGCLAAHACAPRGDGGGFEPGAKLRGVKPIERGDAIHIALQVGVSRLIGINWRGRIGCDPREEFREAGIRQRRGFRLNAEE